MDGYIPLHLWKRFEETINEFLLLVTEVCSGFDNVLPKGVLCSAETDSF